MGSQGKEQRTDRRWHGGLGGTAIDTAIFAAAHANCDDGPARVDKEGLLDSLVGGLGMTGGPQLVAKRVTAMMTDDLLRLLGRSTSDAQAVKRGGEGHKLPIHTSRLAGRNRARPASG